jgi:hypothetical protein
MKFGLGVGAMAKPTVVILFLVMLVIALSGMAWSG